MDGFEWAAAVFFVAAILITLALDWYLTRRAKKKAMDRQMKIAAEAAEVKDKAERYFDLGVQETANAKSYYRATPRMAPITITPSSGSSLPVAEDDDGDSSLLVGATIGSLLSSQEDEPDKPTFGGGDSGGAGASDSWSDSPVDAATSTDSASTDN